MAETSSNPQNPLDDMDDFDYQPGASKKKTMIILAVMAVVIVGGSIAYYISSMIPEEAINMSKEARKHYYRDSLTEFKVAEEKYQKAIQVAGGNYPDATAMLANVFITRGEYMSLIASEKKKKYDRMVKLMEQDPKLFPEEEVKKFAAEIEEQFKKASSEKEKGFKLIKEVMSLAAENFTIQLSMADYYRIKEEYSKLNDIYYNADILDPSAGILFYVKGAVTLQKYGSSKKNAAKLHEAKSLLKKAVDQKPDMLKGRVKLAIVYSKLKEYENAYHETEKILKDNPDHEVAKLMRENLLYQLELDKKQAEANRQIIDALKKEKEESKTEQEKKIEEAEKEIEKKKSQKKPRRRRGRKKR